MNNQIETIAAAFLRAALWADAPEGTAPRITRHATAAAQVYARAFLAAYPDLCRAAIDAPGYGGHPDAPTGADAFGHDLYLTAAGHGAGFWDRDALGDTGAALSEALRVDWRRWYIDVQFYRGWTYLQHNAAA